MDPKARAPQHNDQTSHPPAVTAVSGVAHDRDDFVDRGRIGRIPPALVRWDPAGVMAGHRRRRARTTGSVQQLMSRHGSLLWRADWFAACSNRRGARMPARTSRPLGGVACCRLPGRLRKGGDQRPSSSDPRARIGVVRPAALPAEAAVSTPMAGALLPLLKPARWAIVAGMAGRCGSAQGGAGRPARRTAVLCQAVLVGVAHGLGAVAGAGFVEDPVDVGLDGCVAEYELVGDLAVREAGGD